MRSKIYYIVLITFLFSCTSNQRSENEPETTVENLTEGLKLIFQSGFENGTELVKVKSSNYDLIGADKLLSSPNDWEDDLEAHSKIGYFIIELKDGDESQRYAKLVEDPIMPENKVLKFWLQEGHEPISDIRNKGRVQASLARNTELRVIYQKIRLYIHPDLNLIKSYPEKMTWFGIMEFWNDPNWSSEYKHPFRTSLSIHKLEKGPVESLYFVVGGQSRDYGESPVDLWHEENTEYAVPIGKWMTMETYFREGDNDTGRFFFAVTPDGGKREIIFDIKNYTRNPKDTENGVPFFNPMKLYTSEEIINYIKDNGGAIQLLWDDFELWTTN